MWTTDATFPFYAWRRAAPVRLRRRDPEYFGAEMARACVLMWCPGVAAALDPSWLMGAKHSD